MKKTVKPKRRSTAPLLNANGMGFHDALKRMLTTPLPKTKKQKAKR